MKKNELNIIVCTDKNNLIGDANPTGNGLLWHSKEELEYYKSKTVGNIVLFGLNTSKVVPINLMKKNRTVEILDFDVDIDKLLEKYEDSQMDVFICGGYSIYKHFLKNYKLDNLYISRLKNHVHVEHANNPLYFPEVKELGYKLVSSVEYNDFVAEVYKYKLKEN
ncbi:dihydrofolate reductase [Fusobacterium sp. PH5-44]|uniref:dihydrofolate reductase n=1 Tax=unclassified Fusobacterium TaxID=2648384 RepID=UPI003D1DF2B5